jgi:hypothetical protein
MANTTFNGPVRSENGFEQISVAAATGAVTTNLDIDSSGNITSSGYVTARRSVNTDFNTAAGAKHRYLDGGSIRNFVFD